MQQKITEYKFACLLTYLQENCQTNILLQKELQQVTAIHEIWVLLFKYTLFDLYHLFMEEGFVEILATEIQNPHSVYGYIWFWLSQTKEGRNLFIILLQQGIHPTQKQLAYTREKTSYSTWHYIIQEDDSNLLQCLLQENIYPTFDDLSETILESGLSLWSVLAKNNVHYFYALLKQHILPNSALLSQSKDRQKIYNGWFWLLQDLSIYGSSLRPFLHLIHHRIFPSAEELALEYCIDINTNTGWSFLIRSLDKYAEPMLAILQNLLPTQEILSHLLITYSIDGNHLLNNHWYYLANLKHGPKIFLELLSKKILPQSTDLVNENQNIWRDLAKTSKGAHCIQQLLKQNILPSPTNLFSQDETDPWSVWAILLTTQKYSTFLELINKGILPSSQVLELPPHPYGRVIESAWEIIFEREEHQLYNHLFHHHIIPSLQVIQHHKHLRIFPLAQIRMLFQYYHIQGTHLMVHLLSQQTLPSYYGVLYFLYRQVHDYPHFHFLKVCSTAFPEEISPLFATLKPEDFYLPENRETFAKYYIMTELNNYLQRRICTHKERALSLQQALQDSKDPASIIVNQLLMLERNNSPYLPQQQEKYQAPFQKRYTKGEFHRILQDGFFLCAHRKIQPKTQESLEENWTNIESEETSTSPRLG